MLCLLGEVFLLSHHIAHLSISLKAIHRAIALIVALEVNKVRLIIIVVAVKRIVIIIMSNSKNHKEVTV